MIVDDERAIRGLLRRWLSSWGYKTREAISANDALEQMTAQPASIVFCDVKMPVRDGVWLVGQIRQRWPETAIIMATGTDDLDTVTRLRKQGVVAYVTKPFESEMLLQALRRATPSESLAGLAEQVG